LTIIQDDSVFQALTTIDWDLEKLQPEGGGRPVQDDLEMGAASAQRAGPSTTEPTAAEKRAQE
jgi:hypothetical protein